MSRRKMLGLVFQEMANDKDFHGEVALVMSKKLLSRWDNAVAHYNVGIESPDEGQWRLLTGLLSPYDVAMGL